MEPLTSITLAVCALMLGTWVLSLILGRACIVDSVWSLGFIVVAWVALLSQDEWIASSALVPVLTTVWGLRLSIYLSWRNWGHEEDPRYKAIRKRNEPFWIKSLFIVFGLQGALILIVGAPLLLVQVDPRAPGLLSAMGGGLWLTGLLFETIGDWQLARFKADPANAGQVLDFGLWRYTRHPNYFGDALLWWGLWIVCLDQGAPAWTIFAPAVMTLLLLKVSGVPLLEKRLVVTRPKYADYVLRTSAFLPWPPKPQQSLRDS